MNNDLQNTKVMFYNFKIDECNADLLINEEFTIKEFFIKKNNNAINVYMPKEYNTKWPHSEISWAQAREIISSEFKARYEGFGEVTVTFKDGNHSDEFFVDFEYPLFNLSLQNCSLKLKNNHPFIYMPKNFEWINMTISWITVRSFIVDEFKKERKAKKAVNECIPLITIHDISTEGTALVDVAIPSLNYELTDGAIYYMSDENINVNLPSDFPVNPMAGLTRKSVLKKIREMYLKEIEGMEVNYYIRPDGETDGGIKNKYGRMLNADSTPFAFFANTELRPTGESADAKNYIIVRDLIKALWKNDIGAFEIDTLALLEKFRYMTKTMIIDLFAGGYISHGWRNITLNKLTNIFDRLARYKLVNMSKFVCVDDNDKNKYTSEAMFQIYTLAENGNRLLGELNRSHHYNPFDVYQDGNVVKAFLASNQWLIYWLCAYPDDIKNNFDTAKVVHALGAEKNAARLYALVSCNDTTMIGEPVRRTYDFDSELNKTQIREKLGRIISILNFDGELYVNNGYTPTEFIINGKPIICYICEDDDHMREVWETIKPISEENPDQTIWFTTDARIFNYSYENNRFVEFSDQDEFIVVDINEKLGLGKERAYETANS